MSDKPAKRTRLTGFTHYPSDEESEAWLRLVGLPAFGLWRRMVNLMHSGNRYGYLETSNGVPISVETLAKIVGASAKTCRKLLEELQEQNVFSRDENGVIFSRRMKHDAHVRSVNAANGSKGGNPTLTGDSVNPPDNPPSRGSDNRTGENEDDSVNPPVKAKPLPEPLPLPDPLAFTTTSKNESSSSSGGTGGGSEVVASDSRGTQEIAAALDESYPLIVRQIIDQYEPSDNARRKIHADNLVKLLSPEGLEYRGDGRAVSVTEHRLRSEALRLQTTDLRDHRKWFRVLLSMCSDSAPSPNGASEAYRGGGFRDANTPGAQAVANIMASHAEAFGGRPVE